MRYLIIFLMAVSFNALAATTPVFVSTEWVKNNKDKVILVDMSNQEQYQKYHLPDAIWLKYDWLIRPQDGLNLSGGIHYMSQLLSKMGATHKDYIVIYDDVGSLEASRLYWELLKLNHEKVSIMDGGLVSWVLDGYPVTQKNPKVEKAHYMIPVKDSTNKYTADKFDVLQAMREKDSVILDVRSQDEYLGSQKAPRSGHIPTARLFPWEASMDMTKGYKQREAKELQKYLDKVGVINKKQKIIMYCNSAHRAARLVPMLESLGYKNYQLYDASTQEWSFDPNLPMKRGAQP